MCKQDENQKNLNLDYIYIIMIHEDGNHKFILNQYNHGSKNRINEKYHCNYQYGILHVYNNNNIWLEEKNKNNYNNIFEEKISRIM